GTPARTRRQHVVPSRAVAARLGAQQIRSQPQPAPLRNRGGGRLAARRRGGFRRVQSGAAERRADARAANGVPARAPAIASRRARGIDLREPDRRIPVLLREGGRAMNENLSPVSRRSFLAGVGGAAAALVTSGAPTAMAQPVGAIKRGGTFVES